MIAFCFLIMELEILPSLTKEYVLQHITQEQIFERYLSTAVNLTERIRVPAVLRSGNIDRNASGTFKWSGHKLRFRDWAGGFWGDCFDAVAFIEGIDATSKVGFVKVLDRISQDFRIHKYKDGVQVPIIRSRNEESSITGGLKDTFKNFRVIPRAWNIHDSKYWTKYFIYKPALDYFDVIPCAYIVKEGEVVYEYDIKDPAYAYSWGKDIKGRELYKFYFPYRDKKKTSRFWMNTSVVEGIKRVQKAEIGVITKSYKDVICLKCITANDFSITAISPPSESTLIPKEAYERLWTDCDYIVSLMDFDFQGRNMAWKLKTIYNIPPLFLVNGKRGTKANFGSKDFSDYVAKNGKEESLFLIDKARKYILQKFKKLEK